MANIDQIIRQMSNENTARTFAFNSAEAEKERSWSKSMSDTSHQREVADLERAGLNPVLSANGGANAYSASSASASADNSAPALIASIYQTKLNNENSAKIAAAQRAQDLKIAQMNNKNALQLAKINQATSKYASDKASSASKYASDTSYASSAYSSDTSYKGHVYGVDRTKYGMAYNAYQGATGNSARSTGKKVGSLVKRAVKAVKKWFK